MSKYDKQQTPESKEKSKFRQSAKWKKFRVYLKKVYQNKDYITGKKLYKGFQVHHLDMSLENYKNLDNSSKFIPCNKQTHEMIHWLFRYYQSDKDILKRLEEILEVMCIYNE